MITILGVTFIVFSGFMVVRGAIAPIADGISLRTAKYLTRTIIPIAGGMFADTLEVVVGGSLLIKNAVGIFGLVMILCLVAAPLIKVVAMVLLKLWRRLRTALRQADGSIIGDYGSLPILVINTWQQ